MLTRPQPAQVARKPNGDEPKARIENNELEAMFGYQIRLAYVAISRHFAAAMAHLDLTQKQTGVLWLIGANAGVSQIALATELGMDRASMMAIVDRLEDRKLIIRERSRRDGRRQELYVTPKGRKVLGQAREALAEHERRITSRFSEAELQSLMAALRLLQR